jgi:hypothetical protein
MVDPTHTPPTDTQVPLPHFDLSAVMKAKRAELLAKMNDPAKRQAQYDRIAAMLHSRTKDGKPIDPALVELALATIRAVLGIGH